MNYPFKKIEKKWQNFWKEKEIFKTNVHSQKPKFYCLDMFPYPSGTGLHVGHPEGYTATDIFARYKRMKGFEVLHPMGWDSFGLPAERYAMKTGIHPQITTKKNIDNFRKQIKSLGFSYDWSREIETSSLEYYKFTQWIFLKIYQSYYDKKENKAKPIVELEKFFEKHGVSYYLPESKIDFTAEEWQSFTCKEKEEVLVNFRLVYATDILVNWCEKLGTVLANEEVEEWQEKGYQVVRRPMKQYMMRITAYADRLLEDLELVSWPISTLEMQKNWIGKSEGLEFSFQTEKQSLISVYTTRPDTLFGVTYLVLAPEHPLVKVLTTSEQKNEIQKYIENSTLKSDMERTELDQKKTGVFTGSYAIHPASRKKIPIWISDYVLYGYGTGAVMGVPAHDQRDFEFAIKFNLNMIPVIKGYDGQKAFESKNSICINSNSEQLNINNLDFKQAVKKVSQWVEGRKIGTKKTQYKIRDWVFARQRYWGEPIPLVHLKNGETIAIPEKELPLILPQVEQFQPSSTGKSPLCFAGDWLNYIDSQTNQKGQRETDTMPQWAGSCWYYLRFISPHNYDYFVDKELEKKWMPVDLYVGGAEHAVLHLIYARFWHKVLFDLGYVSTKEPFKKLVHQGLILGEDKRKMSKSLGNVVNPDDIVQQYGADTLRIFEMFMGPFEVVKSWDTKSLEGSFRFLNRVWRLFHKEENFYLQDIEPNEKELKILHRTIQKVEQGILKFSFNTAISSLMIFVNEITPIDRRPREILESFIILLSPFIPHMAEELWEKSGRKEVLSKVDFPICNLSFLEEEEITIVIQVNGKLRGEFSIHKNAKRDKILTIAKQNPKIQKFIQNKSIKKEIYVPNRLVNLVVA